MDCSAPESMFGALRPMGAGTTEFIDRSGKSKPVGWTSKARVMDVSVGSDADYDAWKMSGV